MDYKSTTEKLTFSPRLEKVYEAILPRLKPRDTREGTMTGPECDGKTPFLDAFDKLNPDLPYAVAYAHGIVNSWLQSPVVIYPGEMLVGVPRPARYLYEHFSSGIQEHPEMLDHPAYADRKEEILSRMEMVRNRMFPLTMDHMHREGVRLFGEEGYRITMDGLWWTGGYQGHTIPNYPMLLSSGLDNTLDTIRSYAANTADKDKQILYKAMSVIVSGLQTYIGKYISRLSELAAAEAGTEPGRQYAETAENCRAIQHGKPETFRQAAQLMWFYCLWDWVDCVGRADQYLYPFYALPSPDKEDVAVSLYLKMMEHGVHNMTLAGVNPETVESAANELTYLFLQIGRRVHETHPRMTVRIGKETPPELTALTVTMWGEGMSDPTVVSDWLVIDALRNYGVSLRDARDYSLLGCQEIEIPGKSNFGCEDGALNLAKIFEYTINNGRDRRYDVRVGLETGVLSDYDSMEALWEAFARQVLYFSRRFVYLCNRGQEVRSATLAKLVKSIYTEDCIARGLDLDSGGSVYNYGVAETAGSAAVADAFAALETAVFRDGRLTMAQVEAALDARFAGYEDVRQILLSAPKFGNDEEIPDRWHRRILELFWGELKTLKSVRGGVFTGACSLLTKGMDYGYQTWVLPDGRKPDEPLGNTIGPRTGADTNGVTAMLTSVTKLPLALGIGGTTLNVLLPRGQMDTPEKRSLISSLLCTYLEQGGQMAQVTTASAEDMRAAQKCPERYGSLLVRIGGYSAKFVELSRPMQEELILRYGGIS